MSALLLTDEERRRFALYCRVKAQSCDDMIKQMESLKVPDVLIRKMKTEAIAHSVVANDLDKYESMTIGEGDVG